MWFLPDLGAVAFLWPLASSLNSFLIEYMYHMHVWYLRRSVEEVQNTWRGSNGWLWTTLVAGNQTWSLARAISALNCWVLAFVCHAVINLDDHTIFTSSVYQIYLWHTFWRFPITKIWGHSENPGSTLLPSQWLLFPFAMQCDIHCLSKKVSWIGLCLQRAISVGHDI